MLQAVVIADDFTGACDTGLQFARAGMNTRVVVDGMDDIGGGVDVLVVTSESRNCLRLDAQNRVRQVCEMLGEIPRLLYKKVDSALRGHLATEIRTVMSTLNRDLCLVAPAFPEMGRITVGGYHLVHGVPVNRTEVGNDPGAPVSGSHLEHLLAIEHDLVLHGIGLEEVAKGPLHVQAMIESMRGTGQTVIVLDAASSEDLACIAQTAAQLMPAPLLCGSAGLALHLPDAFALQSSQNTAVSFGDADGPLLVVVGSAESTTRNQVAALKLAHQVREWEVHVDATVQAWRRPHLPGVIDEIAAHLSAGNDAILSLVGLREGHTREEISDAILALAQAVRRVVDVVRPGGVIATGGWTAVEVLRALEGVGVQVDGAVSTGVPLSRICGGVLDGLPLVTKGGALGDVDAFTWAVDRLRGSVEGGSGERPLMGITMGDPGGVGPEVILKALSHDEVYRICRPLVIGHPEILKRDMLMAGVKLDIRVVDSPEEAVFEFGCIDVWCPVDVDVDQIEIGKVGKEAGKAAAEWVIHAIDLAMTERIDGIVTAPLNKEAMNLAGYHYAGHTELLAEKSGAGRAHLMLASERLTVSHVTGHIALREASERLNADLVFETIGLTRDALIGMGKPDPYVAVCGLNPHAGENGLFGQEDAEVVRPAVERALGEGWRVDGPLPADTTFFKVYDGIYDGVVAMYHDQGHVPAKLVAFDEAVNVTLGLPIVRASVDHGTAFDIAGKGIAKVVNMLQAIRVGSKLANQRRQRLAEQ